jgi:ABC-type transporter Mla subunit MlaD
VEDKQHYFRLGLFVVVTATILFGVLFLLGGRSLFQPSFTVESYFDESVAGLEVGAPVKLRGVTLGRVSAIDISAALYQEDVPLYNRKAYVVVRAKITGARAGQWKRDIADYVKRGMRVQTQLAGVTGQQYLALDFLDAEKYPPLTFDWEPDYPYIPSAPSLANQIIANVQSFLASLDKVDIDELGHNLNTLVTALNKRVDELPMADLAAEASALMKVSRAMVERLDKKIAATPVDTAVRDAGSAAARLDALLADPALKQTAENTAAFTGRLRRIADTGELDRIVKNLDQTIRRADAMLRDNQYDVRVIVEDLRVTADNLRALSELAKRYPADLLLGEPPPHVQLPKESK